MPIVASRVILIQSREDRLVLAPGEKGRGVLCLSPRSISTRVTEALDSKHCDGPRDCADLGGLDIRHPSTGLLLGEGSDVTVKHVSQLNKI